MSLHDTEFYPGKYGAKAARFATKDPAEAMRLAMKKCPKGSEKEIFDEFKSIVSNDDEFIEGMAVYCFKHLWRAYEVVSPDGNSVAVIRRERAKRQVKAMVKSGLKRHAQYVHQILMDQVLSCGKLLRDASFGDCKKEGGWLLEVAKAGKANQIVGKHLTEQQVANLWKRHYVNK